MLAQTNFGGNLTIGGVPIFRTLQPPSRGRGAAGRGAGSLVRRAGPLDPPEPSSADGSCMLVVATDAPLDARDLRRLAARAVYGLARTGSAYSNGSGEFAIAFSTSPGVRSRFNETAPRAHQTLPTDATSPLFEATEEAVYNSLFQATTIRSAIGTAEAIPIDRVRDLLKR
ncbi:MAG: P1 family peptidase [Acidobacteria bacterium]|nr:P1 family peptidase [Acidobacteriota bacterium]